jgi:hypothetical protein
MKKVKNQLNFWYSGQIILDYFKANSQYLAKINEEISWKVPNYEMQHLNSKLTSLE